MKQERQRQKTYPVVSTKLHHCLKEELKKKKDISLCSLEHQIPEILKHLDTQTFPEIRSIRLILAGDNVISWVGLCSRHVARMDTTQTQTIF